MQNRNHILNELREISPVVAQIGSSNPYQVPAGYFEGLAEQVWLRIRTGEEGPSPVLQHAGNMPYEVPKGYFEGLAAQVLQRIKAGEDEMSPVLNRAGRNNPYQAPDGYFEGLASTILNRIKTAHTDTPKEELELLSPLLGSISKKTPFSTPDGYFDDLTDNAVAGARAIEFVNEELENLSPVLQALKQQQVYEAPDGYFDNLPQEIIDRINTQQPAKVISISFTRRVMRYAVAAAVAGLILTAGWLYTGNKGGIPDDIQPPVAQATPDIELDNIPDDMLEKYLESQLAGVAEAPVVASYEIDANDMTDLLADVSDDELQQYLEKYSINNKDMLTN